MTPYTRILKNALGFMWDTKLFCVHHINHNHKDNRLENLLLMPKRMHGKYHLCQQVVESSRLCERTLDNSYLFNQSIFIDYINIKADMTQLRNSQYELMNHRSYNCNFDVERYVYTTLVPIYNKYL